MWNLLTRTLRQRGRDEGQDLIEYAMLCALIALVALGAITQVGNVINSALWQVIAAANV